MATHMLNSEMTVRAIEVSCNQYAQAAVVHNTYSWVDIQFLLDVVAEKDSELATLKLAYDTCKSTRQSMTNMYEAQKEALEQLLK